MQARPPRFIVTLIAAALFLFAPLASHAQRPAVEGRHGMVTSAERQASEAGLEMLKKGGNAIDAAVATGFALAATYPNAGNLGGGGFMLIHLADGRDVVIDYRETAPAAATGAMYVGADGKVLTDLTSSTLGWRASGVPGTVAGFAHAFENYGSGKITWAEVIEPARRLAASQVMSAGTARLLIKEAAQLAPFADSKRIFLKDGAFHTAGDTWEQPELAATFSRLQKNGAREFYEGETAQKIAAAMAAHHGTLTLADLKAYRAVERMPLRGRYRGYDILTMPPPSSGGIALLQMLAMLEPHDVSTLGHSSAAKYHLFAEVMKRAFRDRAEYLGDPAFVRVPADALLAPEYLKKRMEDFSPDHATPAANVQPGLGKYTPASPRESTETTHFSVADAAGNVVSNTYTLNGNYGSGVTIPGTGILMNNEMDDFTSLVGAPNMYGLIQGEANAIVPGKRPLSSMTPTLVIKDGKLVLVTGSPGGPTIINTVLQIISNVIDFDMPVAQAVEATRIHHQWQPDTLTFERFGLSADTIALLRAKGHGVTERDSYEGAYQGDGETIGYDEKPGLLLGAADPRKPDSIALGY